jgi:hypothetical protein
MISSKRETTRPGLISPFARPKATIHPPGQPSTPASHNSPWPSVIVVANPSSGMSFAKLLGYGKFIGNSA